MIILDVRYETAHMERGVVGIQLDNNRSEGSDRFIKARWDIGYVQGDIMMLKQWRFRRRDASVVVVSS